MPVVLSSSLKYSSRSLALLNYMHWVRPPRQLSEWQRTLKDKVVSLINIVGVVQITKVDSFTQAIEGRRRVKIVVSLALTAEGKKRVEEEIKN